MAGAVAAKQGNCSGSEFKSRIPYSCKKDPVIIDQTPEAAGENRTATCCRSGVLSAWAVDPDNSLTSFDMVVGNLGGNATVVPPSNLTLLGPGPGYTCSRLVDVEPTIIKVEDGKREEQVLRTWQSTCTYSPFVANYTPSCCVSLSTFYNPNVTPCQACSCGCKDNSKGLCDNRDGENKLTEKDDFDPAVVVCTDDMCPVRIHWHVKTNYRDQWRVKVTISNYRYGFDYLDWNLVVQHPGLAQPTRTFSFNSTRLSTVGSMDAAAIFWGLAYYNTELPQARDEEPSSITSDILIDKDHDSFTLSNGWALPRRIYFNGDTCQMPMLDSYPGLPSSSSSLLPVHYIFFLLSFSFIQSLFDWL